MKPIRLEICAFGPYTRKTVLDFNDLKGRSFFLIHGPTGAGKTTILDAICFALYGDASGEKREAKMLRSSQAAPERATEVDFTFTVGDAVYRAWRSPEQLRPKKRGEGLTLSPADALLYRLDGQAEKLMVQGYAKVTEQLERLLGFKSSQFRQVVLLPQGEFRQLLLANSAQRQEIMETLFKTEFYRQIEERLKARAKDIEAAQTECAKQQQFLMEEAQVESLARLESLLEEQQAAAAGLQQRAAELQQAQQLAQKAESEGRLLASRFAAAAEAAGEMQACRELLPKVEAGRRTYELAEKATGLKARALEVRAFQRELEEAQGQIKAKRVQLQELQLQEKEAAAKASRQQQREDERKAADERLIRLAGCTEQIGELQKAAAEARRCEQRARETASQKEQLEARLTVWREQDEQQQRKLANVQEQAAEEPRWLADLGNRERELEQGRMLARLCEEEQSLSGLCTAKGDLAKSAAAAYEQNLLELERLQHLFAAGQAAILANNLKAKEPCPVCGSCEHPRPAVSRTILPSEAEVREAQNRARLAEEKSRLAQQELVQAQASWRAVEQQLAANRTGDALPEPVEELAANCAIVRSKLTAAQKAREAIAELQEDCERQRLAGEEMTAKLAALAAEAARSEGDWRAACAVESERRNALPEEYRTKEDIERALAAAKEQRRQLYAELEGAEKHWQQLRQEAAAAVAALGAMEKGLVQSEKRWAEAEKDFMVRRQQAGFSTEADYQQAAAWSDEQRDKLRERIRAFEDRLAAAREADAKAQQFIAGVIQPDLKSLQAEALQAATASNEVFAEWKKAEGDIERSRSRRDKLQALARRQAAIDSEYRTMGTLAAVAGGKNPLGLTFQRFVLKSLLADVIDASNMRLKVMSRGQYRLQATDERARRNAAGGLEMEVFDEYTGYARPIATLSGGETFLASLCLALGLADVVQSYAGGIHLDTILVDEGFGTLDPEALDMAIRALIELQKGGRLVGIISHVPELKERIDARLEVTKERDGSRAGFVVG